MPGERDPIAAKPRSDRQARLTGREHVRGQAHFYSCALEVSTGELDA